VKDNMPNRNSSRLILAAIVGGLLFEIFTFSEVLVYHLWKHGYVSNDLNDWFTGLGYLIVIPGFEISSILFGKVYQWSPVIVNPLIGAICAILAMILWRTFLKTNHEGES
jgi:hypothetical protein